MATYLELYDLIDSNRLLENRLSRVAPSDLEKRVVVATLVAADTVREELVSVPNHTQRMTWAARANRNINEVAGEMFRGVVAANDNATLSAIESASDSTVQTNVDALIDMFALNPPPA